MAYNERLAERVRGYFTRRKGVEEKRMFGGLCFMLNGHMCCGIEKDRLMIRVLPIAMRPFSKNLMPGRWILPGSRLKAFCSSVKPAIARHPAWRRGSTRRSSVRGRSLPKSGSQSFHGREGVRSCPERVRASWGAALSVCHVGRNGCSMFQLEATH